MKRIRKWTLATLWAALAAWVCTVPAFADLIIPGQPRQPSPTPDPTPAAPDPAPIAPDPAPVTPDPAPASSPFRIAPDLLTALIIGVALIAAAIIVWVVIRKRRMRPAL